MRVVVRWRPLSTYKNCVFFLGGGWGHKSHVGPSPVRILLELCSDFLACHSEKCGLLISGIYGVPILRLPLYPLEPQWTPSCANSYPTRLQISNPSDSKANWMQIASQCASFQTSRKPHQVASCHVQSFLTSLDPWTPFLFSPPPTRIISPSRKP